MTNPKRTYLLLSGLYLLSFAAFAGWFVLFFVGLLRADAMTLATRIALPVLATSAICLEVFRRLVRRAAQRLPR